MTARWIAAATAFAMLAVAAVAAHEGVRARITLTPERPHAGTPCRVVMVALDAGTLTRVSRRVSLIADMPMHVMPPVEAELHQTQDPNVYTGDIVFTMAGPWRVQLRLEEADETMTAAFEMRVLFDEPAETGTGQQVLILGDVGRATILPPAAVLGSAVALVLLMEAGAIILARRRRRPVTGNVEVAAALKSQ